MNQRGGVINIMLVLIFILFVFLIILNPITQLTDIADDTLATNAGIDKYGTDPNGNIVVVGSASALGDLTMTLLFGIGALFLIGLGLYIARFGQEPIDFMQRRY